jgi:hypothetical protein
VLWLLLAALVCLSIAYLLWLGGRWRTVALVLLGLGLLTLAFAPVAALIVNALTAEACEEGPCGEHVPLFIGLAVEGLLGAVACAAAVAALLKRGLSRAP